jgi:hypothetical protein
VPRTFLPLLVLAISLVAASCVPSAKVGSTGSDTLETATTTGAVDDGTASTLSGADLTPPDRADADDVAAAAFWDAGDFTVSLKPTTFEQDALATIEQWLPPDLVEGLSWEVFQDGTDTSVLAVSVIPTLTWRGDPNFVSALIATLSDADAQEIEDDIFAIEFVDGPTAAAWSTGDGFVISTSATDDVAVTYLETLRAETSPQEVWGPGVCLYMDPETETLPYAPFPPDIVVPCNGPHNAEVLISEQVGTDLVDYDGPTISYERNYQCDKAYTETFGSQKEHTPSLITYMPDQDEWERGDRYLACVVQLESLDGPELIAGPMADRTDLDWSIEVETCFDQSFAPVAVDCGRPHGYQYLGDATVLLDEWPEDGSGAFDDVCLDLLADFVREGPTVVDVFGTGLHPYAFELGDRTIQCMAFAVQDGALAEVAGSFSDLWRVLGSGGVAT